MKRAILTLFFLPLFALKNDPWIPPPYEFIAKGEYVFQYFPSVADAINPVNYDSYVNQLRMDLGASATSSLFFEAEVEFDNSSKVSFNLLSVAPAIKYQMLNDLTGDAMALLIGMYFRYVPENRLIDVATPYSGSYNFDFLASVGKEFDKEGKPVGRAYAMVDVGVATVGYPWFLADIVGEAIIKERNIIKMGVDGFFGLGTQNFVDVDNFNGYANLKHRSLNVKAGYGYKFPVWGELSAIYKRRVVAAAYPQNLNYVGIEYMLGFSF